MKSPLNLTIYDVLEVEVDKEIGTIKVRTLQGDIEIDLSAPLKKAEQPKIQWEGDSHYANLSHKDDLYAESREDEGRDNDEKAEDELPF